MECRWGFLPMSWGQILCENTQTAFSLDFLWTSTIPSWISGAESGCKRSSNSSRASMLLHNGERYLIFFNDGWYVAFHVICFMLEQREHKEPYLLNMLFKENSDFHFFPCSFTFSAVREHLKQNNPLLTSIVCLWAISENVCTFTCFSVISKFHNVIKSFKESFKNIYKAFLNIACIWSVSQGFIFFNSGRSI